MLNEAAPFSDIRTTDAPSHLRPVRTGEAAAPSTKTSAELNVWVAWNGTRHALRRRLKPMGVMGQFTLMKVAPAAPSNDDADNLWSCHFEYEGRAPDFDAQVQVLSGQDPMEGARRYLDTLFRRVLSPHP